VLAAFRRGPGDRLASPLPVDAAVRRRTLRRMDPTREELAELTERAASLRATIARLESELASVNAEQAAIADRLRSFGDADGSDEAKTRVEPVAASGDRNSPAAARTKTKELASLKAAAVGAGLAIGLVIVVLLALDLGTSRREGVAAATGPAASVSPPAVSAPATGTSAARDEIPSPPANAPAAEVPTSLPLATATDASASAASASPTDASTTAASASAAQPAAPGAMTIVCSPRCDSVVDNNVPLSAGSLVNVPVASGPHKLVLSAPNGVKKTVLVNVAPGQTREVRVSMEPAPPPDRGF
jgi:hypothetical protein